VDICSLFFLPIPLRVLERGPGGGACEVKWQIRITLPLDLGSAAGLSGRIHGKYLADSNILFIFVLTKTITDMDFIIQSSLQSKIDTFVESLNNDRIINEMVQKVTDETGVRPNRDEVEIIIQNYIGTLTQY
jgi:hypothetical protein